MSNEELERELNEARIAYYEAETEHSQMLDRYFPTSITLPIRSPEPANFDLISEIS